MVICEPWYIIATGNYISSGIPFEHYRQARHSKAGKLKYDFVEDVGHDIDPITLRITSKLYYSRLTASFKRIAPIVHCFCNSDDAPTCVPQCRS